MAKESVKFQIRDKTYDKFYDRSQIKLGKIFFVREIDGGKDIEIADKEFNGSRRYAVKWIAPSVWAIKLVDRYHLDYSAFKFVHEQLGTYITQEDLLDCLSYHISKLRIEHLYKTSELEGSALQNIFAVAERLELVTKLQTKEVGGVLFHITEPMIVYHLLTCFDLLGQPENWKAFNQWLTSSSCKDERENLISKLDSVEDKIEFSKNLFEEYQNIYGVGKSFYRFINEILPEENRKQLLDSIRITNNPMPPLNGVTTEDNSDIKKARYLYQLRNNYTHKSKVLYGVPFLDNAGIHFPFPDLFTLRQQIFGDKVWISYFTCDWPNVLAHIVKVGLVEFLRKRDKNRLENYPKYFFSYKYFRAFRPDGSEKPGANMIVFDHMGEQVNRLYVPEGFPKDFEWATIPEIDKYNVMYPFKDRSDLIRPYS